MDRIQAAILAVACTAWTFGDLASQRSRTVGSQVAAAVAESAYRARRQAVLARVGSNLLVVPSRSAWIADDQLGFVQASDFQYLTGREHEVGAVLLLDGANREVHLFVNRTHPSIRRWTIQPGREAAQQYGLTTVMPVDSLASWLERRLPRGGTVYVAPTDNRGAESAPLPMANTVARWQAFLGPLGAKDVRSAVALLRPLREIKSAEEIAILQAVGRTSGEAMLAGMRELEPGRTQWQTEVAVVRACVDAGARGISFWPWTRSGPSGVPSELFSSFVDYNSLNRVMQAGELVRVDVGCQVNHYMGDVGRTAPVSGRFDPGQREAWNLFIAGYRAGLALVKDGASTKTIFDSALAEIRRRAPGLRTSLGKDAAEVLLGPNGTAMWQFHGVGLDVAEGAPDTLRTGMVVAYEIMFDVGGEGYYLEDMLAVTADGHQLLTENLPYTAEEIEAAMARRR